MALTEAQLYAHLQDPAVATVLLRRHIKLTKPLIYNSGSVAVVGSCAPANNTCTSEENDNLCTITGQTFGGEGIMRAWLTSGSTLTLRGIRFKDGYNGEGGGALMVPAGVHLHIAGCQFVGNSAKVGGAIHTTAGAGSVLIEDTAFTGNEARLEDGGAVYLAGLDASAALVFKSTTFTENEATWSGGAVYTKFSHVRMDNCTFTRNTAVITGGAVAAHGAKLTVAATAFVSNTAVKGGAVALNGGVITATKTSFTSNVATAYGGAIFTATNSDKAWNFNLTVELDSCAIT